MEIKKREKGWKEKQVMRNEMKTTVSQKGDIKNNGPKNQ